MTESDLRQKAIELYDHFTHEGRDRRSFMRDLTLLTGSTAAANALLMAIAADPAVAGIVPADDKRVKAETISWESAPGRKMTGYSAAPADKPAGAPTIIVIHENRGLNEHTRDVARRFAIAGFAAIAPDFLAPVGGTPADEDKAREMIGALTMPDTIADGVAMVNWLNSAEGGNRRVGVVGFCWGGAMVNHIAVNAGSALKAGVVYYGVAPDVSAAPRVQAPLVIQLAGLDERVNKSALPWAAALRQAGKSVEVHEYPGVNHAFNNDTSVERYDKAAADLAWQRTTDFFRKQLMG